MLLIHEHFQFEGKMNLTGGMLMFKCLILFEDLTVSSFFILIG